MTWEATLIATADAAKAHHTAQERLSAFYARDDGATWGAAESALSEALKRIDDARHFLSGQESKLLAERRDLLVGKRGARE